MKSDNVDVVCNTSSVYDWLPRLEFDMKSDKINIFCNALLVSSSRLEFDMKSDEIDVCLQYIIGFQFTPEAGISHEIR